MSNANQSNKFAIHDAIKEGNTLLAKKLIDEQPASKLYISDDDERTPLHWAVSFNNLDLVQYILLKTPNDLDIDEYVDGSGWTPLHIAASLGNSTIFNQLLRRANGSSTTTSNNSTQPELDVNLQTNSGTTCLHLAISKNNYDIVKELIETYKANCRIKDKKGYTPLHRAASIGSIPIIKLLVEKGKININAQDNDGWTSLHHALAEGHGDVAVLLVKLGADPNIVNNDGETPVKVAVDDKVAKYFTENI